MSGEDMKPTASLSKVPEIMAEFARLTGLSPDAKTPRRYLWTDAFAVCNYLELYRQTGEPVYKDLALRLVDQVHTVLGRHREDDPRVGWISGLNEEDGRRHPTAGGLRIGKPLNERKATDPFDERREWDRDGQYYHYLTKWMHALHQVSRTTGDPLYSQWAVELAKTAHAKFTYRPSSGGPERMVWKMSIDLSYALVPAMGQHDPLDGLITYSQLQAQSKDAKASKDSEGPDLNQEIAEMAEICKGENWATDDPLGLGGLLCDAFRMAQMVIEGRSDRAKLVGEILAASLLGLQSFAKDNPLALHADYRLAFRELGLSIGLHALDRLRVLVEERNGLSERRVTSHWRSDGLVRYVPLARSIERFWLDPKNQESETWTGHRDINMVMLATSLAPDAYLTL
jgi:hypothetical protein